PLPVRVLPTLSPRSDANCFGPGATRQFLLPAESRLQSPREPQCELSPAYVLWAAAREPARRTAAGTTQAFRPQDQASFRLFLQQRAQPVQGVAITRSNCVLRNVQHNSQLRHGHLAPDTQDHNFTLLFWQVSHDSLNFKPGFHHALRLHQPFVPFERTQPGTAAHGIQRPVTHSLEEIWPWLSRQSIRR